MEIQPACLPVAAAQRPDKEIPELIFLAPHHLKRSVKKFRQDNEIHRNVILPRRKDLLNRILIQKSRSPSLSTTSFPFKI